MKKLFVYYLQLANFSLYHYSWRNKFILCYEHIMSETFIDASAEKCETIKSFYEFMEQIKSFII